MVCVIQGRDIAEGNSNIPIISVYVGLWKKSVCHLREHTRDALTLVSRKAQVH